MYMRTPAHAHANARSLAFARMEEAASLAPVPVAVAVAVASSRTRAEIAREAYVNFHKRLSELEAAGDVVAWDNMAFQIVYNLMDAQLSVPGAVAIAKLDNKFYRGMERAKARLIAVDGYSIDQVIVIPMADGGYQFAVNPGPVKKKR